MVVFTVVVSIAGAISWECHSGWLYWCHWRQPQVY